MEERRSPPSACGTDVDFEVIAVSAFAQLAIPYRRGARRALFFPPLFPLSPRGREFPLKSTVPHTGVQIHIFISTAVYTDFFFTYIKCKENIL